MNTTDKIEENATAQDLFKFIGVVITFIFSAFIFFLKLLGDSNNTNEVESHLAEEEYNDLTSTSIEALSNPNNLNHDS